MMAPVRISYFTRGGDKLIQRMRQRHLFDPVYTLRALCVCIFFWRPEGFSQRCLGPDGFSQKCLATLKDFLRGVWRTKGFSQRCLASWGLFSEASGVLRALLRDKVLASASRE